MKQPKLKFYHIQQKKKQLVFRLMSCDHVLPKQNYYLPVGDWKKLIGWLAKLGAIVPGGKGESLLPTCPGNMDKLVAAVAPCWCWFSIIGCIECG